MKYRNQLTDEETEEIERFLQQEMDESEAADFSQRMRENEELRQKVDEVKLTQLAIGEIALKERLDEYHEAIQTVSGKPVNRRVIQWGVSWKIAATILFVVVAAGTWLLFTNNNSHRLYSRYYKPDPGLMTAMSGDNDNYEFEKAMVEYKSGDYRKALSEWGVLLEKRPASDTLLYFMGAASQAVNENDKAIMYFEKVAQQGSGSFLKDAYWYLGLAWLKNGATDKAINYIRMSEYPQSDELINDLQKK